MQYFTGGRCASHLASYIDDLLRTGLNGVSEEEVDAKLEKVFFLLLVFICSFIRSFFVCFSVVLKDNRYLQVHLG